MTVTQQPEWGWLVDPETGDRLRPATREEAVQSAMVGQGGTIRDDAGRPAVVDGSPYWWGTGDPASRVDAVALVIGSGYASCSYCGRRADASFPRHTVSVGAGEPCGRYWTGVAPAFERGAGWELRASRDATARTAREFGVPVVAPRPHQYVELDDPAELGDGPVALRVWGPGNEAAQARRQVRPRWWERHWAMRQLTGRPA